MSAISLDLNKDPADYFGQYTEVPLLYKHYREKEGRITCSKFTLPSIYLMIKNNPKLVMLTFKGKNSFLSFVTVLQLDWFTLVVKDRNGDTHTFKTEDWSKDKFAIFRAI